MSSFIKRVQNTIFQHKLINYGDKIIVGVSGGPDSVCLLDVLYKLKDKYGLELLIAHINYGLRGQDSDKDEKLARKSAGKYNLPIEILRPKVSDKSNLENKLRDIRYRFFEKLRRENGFDLIAIAHNLDDQTETFLMRVLRGSGLAGMASMKYKNGPIVRPLLSTKRLEIEEYLRNNKLEYRVDKTNLESKFFRNRIRNKLIPYIEKNFNPSITDTLFETIGNIAEDYACLDEITEKTCEENRCLSASSLLNLHPAIQRRILLKAVGEKRSGLKDISSSHVREMLKAIKSIKNKQQVVLFKGLKLTKKGDRIEIETLKK